MSKERQRSRTTWTRILDGLWRKAILKRDQHRCRRCGATDQLQAAHIHSRKFRSTRWDTDNGHCLCAGCHFWAHQHPTTWTAWLEDQVGKDMLARLNRRASEPQHVTIPWLQDMEQQLLKELE